MTGIDWLNRFAQRVASVSRGVQRRLRRKSLTEQLEPRLVLAAPVLPAIPNATVTVGSPLLVSLNATDADGQKLTYSVSVTNNKVTGDIHQNRSATMNVK